MRRYTINSRLSLQFGLHLEHAKNRRKKINENDKFRLL